MLIHISEVNRVLREAVIIAKNHYENRPSNDIIVEYIPQTSATQRHGNLVIIHSRGKTALDNDYIF